MKVIAEGHTCDGFGPPPKSFARKYSPDQPRDDHGRFGEGDGTATVLAPDDAVRQIEAGADAPAQTAYRVITAGDYDTLRHGGALPAGQHNEERLGHGASFRLGSARSALRFAEPGVEHRLIRIDLTDDYFHGHERGGSPGDIAITVPLHLEHVDKVGDPFVRPSKSDVNLRMRLAIERAKYSPDQPRDHGRFDFVNGGSATPNLDAMRRRLREEGGFTVDPASGSFPTEGVTVRAAGIESQVTPSDDFFNDDKLGKQALRTFFDAHATDLKEHPSYNLGGWYDAEHHEVVLDVIERMTGPNALAHALQAGAERGEQGVYDLATGTYHSTGGSGHRDTAEHLARTASRDYSPPEGLGGDDRGRKAGVHRSRVREDDGESLSPLSYDGPIEFVPFRTADDVDLSEVEAWRKADEADWSEVDAWLGRNDVKSVDVFRTVHEHDHPGETFRYVKDGHDVSGEPRDDHGRWTNTFGSETTLADAPKAQQAEVKKYIRDKLHTTPEGIYKHSRELWDNATDEQKAYGIGWYQRVHDDIQTRVASKLGGDMVKAVGMLAVQSQNNIWEQPGGRTPETREPNMATTLRTISMLDDDAVQHFDEAFYDRWRGKEDGKPGGTQRSVLSRDDFEAFQQRFPDGARLSELDSTTAARFLSDAVHAGIGANPPWEAISHSIDVYRGGDPHDAIVGQKIQSFYNNIADPQHSTDVTIDRWMLRGQMPDRAIAKTIADNPDTKAAKAGTVDSKVLGNPPTDAKFRQAAGYVPNISTYTVFADAVRRIAEEEGRTPNDVQAVLWKVAQQRFNPKGK